MPHRLVLLLSLFLLAPAVSADAEIERIRLGDGIDMDLRRFSAEGDTLLLGFPCDLGMGRAEAQAGEVLSQRGIEVWMADLLGAHFLPIAPSSMRSLEGREVARLIRHAVETTDKRIILIASGYGAVPALRGARIWQAEHPDSRRLDGAILFYPMLSAHNPEPGQPLEYLEVVHHTRLPMVIMQPTNTPTRFWVDKLKQTLENGGSRVQVELLPGVRGHFYDREDATEAERAMAGRLPELVEQALKQLTQMEAS
ncbi:alpha/beta fold hydrolase [Thiohalobacter thiocyanaticus]|uniref:Uncharacterized protein n=1 Tax=Thiohalobacter thiocyanaticus TaxID=585455 RepID=A0A426QM84_9GAMM|nr:hypothetical protein [Thiohalobacter thiocyanaticus]RRQ22874.1 hypothetical protein D6C00_13680 [Thiohalobacter thiocyanaticus]